MDDREFIRRLVVCLSEVYAIAFDDGGLAEAKASLARSSVHALMEGTDQAQLCITVLGCMAIDSTFNAQAVACAKCGDERGAEQSSLLCIPALRFAAMAAKRMVYDTFADHETSARIDGAEPVFTELATESLNVVFNGGQANG